MGDCNYARLLFHGCEREGGGDRAIDNPASVVDLSYEIVDLMLIKSPEMYEGDTDFASDNDGGAGANTVVDGGADAYTDFASGRYGS